MIVEDIENMRTQLLRISQGQNGQLYLNQQDATTFFNFLNDLERRTEELEMMVWPLENGLAAAAGHSNYDSTNVVAFPRNKTRK